MVIAMIAMMIGSCGNKNGNQQTDIADEDTVVAVDLFRDSTKYGICGDGSAMNTLQLLLDSGDTLIVDVSAAQDAGKVFGGYEVGDRMAVMMASDNATAKIVINQSALLGNWVMPNPIDGSDEIGISIKEGGIAEGIEQSTTIYKTWRIFNGKLELIAVREGGGDNEETYLYDLIRLTPDSLIFKDSEDSFEYSRQKANTGYGVDIVLEEASEEDYHI